VFGDTTRAGDDTTLACALPGSLGNDLVYTFQVDRPKRITATAVAMPGSALMPVLGLRKVCASLAAADNNACAYGGANNLGATLTADVQPGTWYLWLDGEGGTAGAFKLTLALSDTNAGSCSSPIELLFSGGRAQGVSDTRGATDDARGLCGGGGAPDNVYAFELEQPQRVSVEVEPLSQEFAPAVYVRGATCTDATPYGQLSCAIASPGTRTTLDLPRLPAGRYHLFVDGSGTAPASMAGPYRFTVTLLDTVPPPPNDTCAGAATLPAPMNGIGTVTVQGDTAAATDDARGCGGDGPDLVYRLELSGPRRVAARVQPQQGSTLRPLVYVRRPGQCESQDPGDLLGCGAGASAAGSAAALTLPSLPAGLYFLWVDGLQGTAGAFELTIDLQAAPPPPQNDVCTAAPPLALASGVVTATGTTVSAGDDASLWCTEPLGAFSPDVVYSIDVPVKQALAIDVQAPAGSALLPVFSLRPPMKCASNGLLDNLDCAWGDPQHTNRTVLNLPEVEPGRYSLWVEGDGATQGAFTLRVVTSPPVQPPENDWCGSTFIPTLSPGVPVSGDTRAALDDSAGGCGGVSGANGEYARDVLYRFSLSQSQSVKVTVTPDPMTGALYRPLVYVKGPSMCASTAASATLGCAAAANLGESAVLNLGTLAAGTYSLWVDGAGLSSGSFSVRLQ